MAFLLNQYMDFSGIPVREVVPNVSYGNIAPSGALQLAGGATFIVKHDARGINPPDSNDWIIGQRNLVSWNITANSIGDSLGLTLLIETSSDGVGFRAFQGYYINGYDEPEFMADIPVPSYMMRISLINASPDNITTVRGMIQIKGVA